MQRVSFYRTFVSGVVYCICTKTTLMEEELELEIRDRKKEKLLRVDMLMFSDRFQVYVLTCERSGMSPRSMPTCC